jgi:hypothetical protein
MRHAVAVFLDERSGSSGGVTAWLPRYRTQATRVLRFYVLAPVPYLLPRGEGGMTEGRAIMFLISDLSFAGLPLNTAP